MRHDETPEDFLAARHDDVVQQREYLKACRDAFQRHLNRNGRKENYPHDGCQLCLGFDSMIADNETILDQFNDDLRKAQNGIYE